MANGVRTTNIENQVALSDELIVNRDGQTGVQTVEDFFRQVAASGAVAEALDAAKTLAENNELRLNAAEDEIVTNVVYAATWSSDLEDVIPTFIGQGAEIIDEATGTHIDPVSGQSVSNAGRYKAYDTIAGAWARIGDTGLSKKTDKTDFQKEQNRNYPLRAQHLLRDAFVGWAFPLFDQSRKVAAGLLSDGSWFAKQIVMPFSSGSAPSRDVPFGEAIIQDSEGSVAMHVTSAGEIEVSKFGPRTKVAIAAMSSGGGGSSAIDIVEGVGGYNHRRADDDSLYVTMPTFFGPCDVQLNSDGGGDGFAMTRQPFELLSMSGQSNTLDGGNTDFHGAVLKHVSDPHRSFRGNVLFWGDGVGSGAAYVDGDITSVRAAGQTIEYNGLSAFTPDAVNFSCVAIDQREQNPQTVYVQMVSAEGSTSLLEYFAGEPKGDNIKAFIPGAETMLSEEYGRETVMYAHFLFGHENPTFTGYADYSAMLSAFADEVCGYGETLDYNTANSIRPKVLAYQPNNAIGTADGTTITGGATGTLACSLTDPDVVCIGPVYHERTVDGGIHMVAKLMTAELFAHVYNIVKQGGSFTPLHVAAAVRSGSTIMCDIDGPEGFVERDTDWLPQDLPTDGIKFTDDSSSASISSISITNTSGTARTLTIELDAVPTGANPTLTVAGVNNATDETWSGGMCSFFVRGPLSFWHRAGLTKWTTPEIRHYLCRNTISVTN